MAVYVTAGISTEKKIQATLLKVLIWNNVSLKWWCVELFCECSTFWIICSSLHRRLPPCLFFLMLLGGIKVRFFFLEIMAYVLSGHIPKKQNKTKNSEKFALLSVTKLQNIKWHCPLGPGEQLWHYLIRLIKLKFQLIILQCFLYKFREQHYPSLQFL